LLALLGGLALRLWFVFKFPVVQGDSLIYTDIARNWLNHGVFGSSDGAAITPTLIRLPGYAAFLAAVFALFGDNSFSTVTLLQVAIDLASCWAIAELAAAMVPEGLREQAHKWAFVVAALCPFTANYVALPLTETLSIATTAWALVFAVRTLKQPSFRDAAATGVLCALGCLLRPDNGILVAVICTTLLIVGQRPGLHRNAWALDGLRTALIVGTLAVVPLIPWTVRNWKTFHVFQPLAPRYANNPDEFVPRGFNRWVKTWIVDYVSTEEIYWRIDESGDPVDPDDLPRRAFDSGGQREATYQLLYDVPSEGLTPQTDAQFGELAQQRIRGHLLRYYVVLPLARIADMWLRPRIEMLPLEQRWWDFEDRRESWIAIGLGAINLGLVVLAVIGALHFRGAAGWLLIAFVVVRSLFLGTLENPEPRYTLECFPVVLAFAAIAIASFYRKTQKASAG
jgi:hypothetical protein